MRKSDDCGVKKLKLSRDEESRDVPTKQASGVNWAKQLKEYQKLQNKESMEALGNKTPFEVFYGRKSNAVLNYIPGGRCIRERTSVKVQSPKSTDFAQNKKKLDTIRSRAKKSQQCLGQALYKPPNEKQSSINL